MKLSKKIMGLTAIALATVSVGVLANPYQHLKHINHRENKVVRHDTHAINRAYAHGNYHKAHRLERNMHAKMHQLNHERNRVYHHHFG